MKFAGTIQGRKVFVEEYGLDCSEQDIAEFLKYFKRIEVLRSIAQISSFIFMRDSKSIIQKYSFMVNDNLLINAAFLAVKHCRDIDTLNEGMSGSATIHFLKMCGSFIDKKNVEITKDPMELLLLHSYNQFAGQENKFNVLVRNYFIYEYLWSEVDIKSRINIKEEIKNMIGIPLRVAVLLLFTSLNSSFIRIFNDDQLRRINERITERITKADHKSFLDWASLTFDEVINWNKDVNPFYVGPLINTKIKPFPELDSVYIVVSHTFLYEKITTGLYFALMDKYNFGGKDNLFKEIFGKVFERYVGELLIYYLPDYEVFSEIGYKNGNNKTVDWLVKKDNHLILIEAKQSALHIKSKNTGKKSYLKKDIDQNICKSIDQLINTEREIKSVDYEELSEFSGVNSFIKVVVTYDSLHFANLIIKEAVQEKKAQGGACEIMDINDLELLLVFAKNNQKDVWDILSKKMEEKPEMDCKEFLYSIGSLENIQNKFLGKYYDEIFKGI